MFWGLIMEPQRRYSQKVKKSFHISMAALDISNANDEPVQVMCCYEGRNYLLCTLRKSSMLQCSLDLSFEEGSEISFASNGKSHVHLTGYLLNELDNLLDEGDLEEQEEEEEVEEPKKRKNKEKATKTIEPPKKKSKLSALVEEIAEEEDEDDDDFQINEDSDSDAEEVEEEEGDDEDEEEEDSSAGEEQESSEEEAKPAEQPKVNGVQKESKKDKKAKKENAQKEQQKQQQQKKAPKKVLQGGVSIEDLKEGQGPTAKNGKFINVYYEGRLQQNNKLFDSSKSGNGFRFRLGAGEVIKGWDVGVAGMKQGGKRRIVCPPNSAYGPKGSPPVIPPNSTLVFEVELLKVK